MQLIYVVVLVCSSAVARPDCQVETAIDVLVAPEVWTAASCGLQAQAYVAGSGLARNMEEGRYLKILCTRRQVTATIEWPQQ